jgi:hypothetical protein
MYPFLLKLFHPLTPMADFLIGIAIPLMYSVFRGPKLRINFIFSKGIIFA